MKNTQFQSAYENKKKSSEARHIPFELSLCQYSTLMLLRNTLRCAYSDKVFVMNKGSDHDLYPTLERIDPVGSYNVDNVIICTRVSNSLKQKYIEANGSLKGCNAKTISAVHRINKILAHQENLDKILTPYKEAYALNSAESDYDYDKQKLIAQENTLKLQAEKKLKKYEDELSFAQHFYTIANEFKSIAVPLQITIGEMKKKMQCLSDQVTGKPFASVNEKRIFVVNKALPVTRHNVKIVHASTQNALDVLTLNVSGAKMASNLTKMF